MRVLVTDFLLLSASLTYIDTLPFVNNLFIQDEGSVIRFG
jgi:hypothetical protein